MTDLSLLAALLVLVVACGRPPPPPPATIKEPNVASACDLAIACGVFAAADHAACVDCLEELAKRNEELIKDVPPLDTVECSIFEEVAAVTNMRLCVDGRWYTRGAR